MLRHVALNRDVWSLPKLSRQEPQMHGIFVGLQVETRISNRSDAMAIVIVYLRRTSVVKQQKHDL